MRKILLTAASVLAMGVAHPAIATTQEGQAIEVPPIDFTERVLDNGFRVISIQDNSTPDVYVSMWYEVGSKHDPDQKSGFAHLFEHVLSRKTVNIPYGDISNMVDNVGGTRNASTWLDRTNYYELVPAEYLERMLWTHAERMARPVIDEEVFLKEREIVKEEMRQRYLAPPYGRTLLALQENLYNLLPTRRPGIGNIENLDNSTLADTLAFHEAYYGPDTATLIVAGNFQQADLDRLVDKYFADIPARENPASLEIDIEEQPIAGSRLVTITSPNAPLPQVGLAWQMPKASHPDMAALFVLEAILTSGDNNRLDPALVKTGLSSGVGGFLNPAEEAGFFFISATVASGADPSEAAAALDAAIDRVRESEPSEAELVEARNELISNYLSGRETITGRANEIGEALVSTGDSRASDKWLQGIGKVTAADVQRVANLYLRPDSRLELRYERGDGDAAGWANPVPMPTFQTPPPATHAPLALRPEEERETPPDAGAVPDIPRPDLQRFKLSNGMELLAGETGKIPFASVAVLFEGGSVADNPTQAGRANLAASLADKGTASMAEEEVAASLERLGASMSASASADGTFFIVSAPTANLAEATAIMSDVIRNASYPEDVFERERKRALDNLDVALNDPTGIASRLIGPVIYGDAPYAIVSGGTPQSLAGLTRADLVNYRETWWRPELAKIIVAGGVSADQARQIAEASFGDWTASGTAPAIPADRAGAETAPRTLVVDLPGAGQAAVYAVARGISRDDDNYYAAELANAVLGGSSTARLFDEIRAKRALSYGSYSQVAERRDDGYVVGSAQTKNESVAEVAEILLREFKRIGDEPIDDQLIDKRRIFLKGGFERGIQTSSGFIGTIAGALLNGITPEEALAFTGGVDAATSAQASKALGDLIDPGKVSLIIVGDSKAFIDDLRALRPDVEVFPADQLDIASARATD